MKTPTPGFRLLTLAGALVIAPSLRASFVFTDFDAGNKYNHPFSWAVSDTTSGYQEIAMPFIPTENSILTSIDIALGYGTAGSSVIISVHSDSGNSVGALLATGPTFTPTIAFNDSGSDIANIDFSASGVTLTNGTKYWVDAKATSGSSLGWNEVNNTSGPFDFRTSPTGGFNGTSGKLGGFDVNGTMAPEPATPVCLLSGFVVLLGRRNKRVTFNN